MRYTVSKDGRAEPAVPKPRGGTREGAGRKPINDGGAASATLTVRVTQAQKNKVMALGGSEWIRQMIDIARAPGSR
jgi:hypothetical protein